MKITLNVLTKASPPYGIDFSAAFLLSLPCFAFAERCGTVQRKHRRCIQRRLGFSGTVVDVFRIEALCQVQTESGNRPYRRRNAIHGSAFVQRHPFCSRVGDAAAQRGTLRGKRSDHRRRAQQTSFSLVTQKGIDHPSKLAGKESQSGTSEDPTSWP